MQIRPHLLDHFGLRSPGIYEDRSTAMFTRELAESIRARSMTALTGPVGAGKTHLVRRALQSLPSESFSFVHVRDMSPKGVTLQSLLAAIVYDLSSESPRRSMEARSRQVVRLMAQRTVMEQRPVCIIVEDAHRLHPDSLNELKLLREASFQGVSPLCGLVLVGWPVLAEKIKRLKAVALRTDVLRLSEDEGYMTLPQRIDYLQVVFGAAIAPDTRQVLASLYKTPEEMNHAVAEAMQTAFYAGFSVLDARTITPDPADLAKGLEASQRDIAREAGVGVATVNRVLHGQGTPEQRGAVMSALDRLSSPQRQAA